MQTLSIDIETYSDVNLSKCGVYKYAESPDFEILLFGYSVDGSEVTVIDLAQGERLPQEIIDALTDDSVIKWAFNANFERVCLSRYLRDLGVSLDPFHDKHPLSTECARFLNPKTVAPAVLFMMILGAAKGLSVFCPFVLIELIGTLIFKDKVAAILANAAAIAATFSAAYLVGRCSGSIMVDKLREKYPKFNDFYSLATSKHARLKRAR